MTSLIVILILAVGLLLASLFLAMLYVEDDTKLKIVLWIIIILSVIAIIGIWESVIKPLGWVIQTYLFPQITVWWNTYVIQK